LIAAFALTSFIGSALLFVVEPMFAKMLLPLLGGSPAVWNTCVVFFQASLLAGYAYAHVLTTRLSMRHQAAVHCALVLAAAAALPVAVPSGWTPPVDRTPIPWVLLALAVGVGAPFMVISTTAPLLQKWFSGTDHRSARDPYHLYSASNVGSILALLAYPFLIEPSLPLTRQKTAWSVGYALFAALTVICAFVAMRRQVATPQAADDAPATAIGWPERARWLGLSAVPSSLLLGLTTYVSTDIAAVPLLWTIPLTFYLLSFVLAFAQPPLIPMRLAARAMPLLVAVLVPLMAIGPGGGLILVLVPLHLVTFFVCALHLHGTLAERRPPTRHLTEFYLWIAAGGVLGALFNTLIAPVVFTGIIEYPAAVIAACLMHAGSRTPQRPFSAADLALPSVLGVATLAVAYASRSETIAWGVFMVLLGVLAIWCFSFSDRPVRFGLGVAAMLMATQFYGPDARSVLLADRTFFGVLRVRAAEKTNRHILMHGSTVHGEQSLDPERRREPLTYYHRSGPIGQVMDAFGDRLHDAQIGVVGLGAGSLAAYVAPGQQWTFYEIDPAVVRLTRDTGAFTYMQGCRDACEVVLGDARLSLARPSPVRFSLLVLDAFSSDGIPVHLVTREALDVYLRRLNTDGVIAFHISNRHLQLRPILAALAAERGLAALVQRDDPPAGSRASGRYPSEWLLMARHPAALGTLATDRRWQVPAVPAGTHVWTDDFSDVLAALKTNWGREP
jgi:hypothetical protein